MPPMRSNPPDEITLHRHATQNSKRVDDHRAGLEAGMREKTVKPNRDSETRQQIHHSEESEIERAEMTTPEQDHRRDHADRRQKNHHEADQLPEKSWGLLLMYALYGTIG